MYGLAVWMLSLVLVVSALIAQTRERTEINDQALAERYATQLAVYGRAVERYAQANPSVTGAVADTALVLPTWFVRDAQVRNYVQAGRAYTYATARDAGDAYAIAEAMGGDATAGVKTAGRLNQPGAVT
jgi:hypothetical protein